MSIYDHITDMSDEANLKLPELTKDDMNRAEYTVSMGHLMTEEWKILFNGAMFIAAERVNKELSKPDKKTSITFFTVPSEGLPDVSVQEQMDFMTYLFIHRKDIIIKRSIDHDGHYCLVFIDKKKL
jgi:hypothetical protein